MPEIVLDVLRIEDAQIAYRDGKSGHETPLAGLKDSWALDAVKHWLQRDAEELPEKERAALDQALHSSTVLRTIYSMRQELSALWSRSTASTEQLVKQLEDWCRRAEESGISALQEFSRKLRCYD